MRLVARSMQDDSIDISEMQDNDFALAIEGQYQGEVFYKNVAGIHGLTDGRYWPSEFIEQERGRASAYVPKIRVRLFKAGDILTIQAK